MLSNLAEWNVLGLAIMMVAFLLPVAALFSIWAWRGNMEITHVLLWAAIVIFAPLLGSIVWFAVGKRLHLSNRGVAVRGQTL